MPVSVASALVRTDASKTDRVASAIERLEGASVVGRQVADLAVVLEADDRRAVEALLERFRGIDGVVWVDPVFYGETDEEGESGRGTPGPTKGGNR